MKFGIKAYIRNIISGKVNEPSHSENSTKFDIREEYAKAFRTESYNEFWKRVVALTNGDLTISGTVSSTTATRLPSYRLFAEHLLDPDQTTVTQILELTNNRGKTRSILFDYFSETAQASVACGSLLKSVDVLRVRYRALRTTLKSLETGQLSITNHSPVVLNRLMDFSNYSNPFITSASSPQELQAAQVASFELFKRLELGRDKAQGELRVINKLKHGSAVTLAALTVSLTVIILTHSLAMLVAAPSLLAASTKLASARKLARLSAQLDVAAKGTYTLSRDLDTISRLVARLNDELNHMQKTIMFWLDRVHDPAQAITEVAQRLKKNDSRFSEQLDELEEHLYLCFMTINRARNLAVKEIMAPVLVL